jgi:hypothetical protein
MDTIVIVNRSSVADAELSNIIPSPDVPFGHAFKRLNGVLRRSHGFSKRQ